MSEFLPPVILELRAKAGELKSELGTIKKELGEVDKKSDGTSHRMGRAFSGVTAGSKALMMGMLGAGGVVAAFGVEAAMTGQVADTRLRVAITNAGGSFEKLHDQLDEANASGRRFGFTNAETETALATMTLGLHSPTKALQFLGVAQDLARQKGLGLNEAALLVTKGFEGQTRPLKALGIDLPVYAGNAHAVQMAQMALVKAHQGVTVVLSKYHDAMNVGSKHHAVYLAAIQKVKDAQAKLSATQHSGTLILNALHQRTLGAAKAYGETFAGKLQVAKAQMDNLGERIGFWLIPKLETLMTVTSKTITWLGKHKDVVYGLGAAITVALIPAVLGLTAALLASPITWIALAVGALVIGILYLAKNWHKVWDDIKKWTSEGAAFVRKHWLMILAIPIVGWMLVLAANWRNIWNVIQTVTRVGSGVVRTIFGYIRTDLGILGAGATAFGRVWSSNWGFVKLVIAGAVAYIGGMIHGVITLFGFLIGAVRSFGATWSGIWSWVTGVISSAAGVISSVVGGIENAVNSVMSAVNTVSHIAHTGGKFNPLNWDTGGPVPGPVGRAVLGVVHGGEFVLSHGMLTGQAAIPAAIVGAVVASTSRGVGRSSAATGGYTRGGGGGMSAGCNCGPITIELDGRVLARSNRQHNLQYGGRNPSGKTSPTFRR
jgi:hypothetical protein